MDMLVPSAAATPSAPGAASVWRDLAAAGATLLNQLRDALSAPPTGAGASQSKSPAAPSPPRVAVDASTGETFLRLPLPSRDTLTSLVNLLSSIAGR